MQNVRETLIARMRQKLATATEHMPGSIAMAMPLGAVAEAAMEVLAGGARIPTIPTYDATVAAQRHWYGGISTAELDEGAQYPVLSVHRDGDAVIVMVEHGAARIPIRLIETDAADFGLSCASAAYAPDQPAPEPPRDVPEVEV